MKKLITFLSLILFLISLQGCLTVETKEYSFKIKKDRSGNGRIRYINIMSDNRDSLEVVESDYKELVESFLNGMKLEGEFPNIKNVKKRLYEEDNRLCGEFSFEFDDISKLKFYNYKDKGPWCYYISNFNFSSGTESYFTSNGTYGGESMPVIFWDGNQKEFEFKTTVSQPGKNTLSLLEMWKTKGEK